LSFREEVTVQIKPKEFSLFAKHREHLRLISQAVEVLRGLVQSGTSAHDALRDVQALEWIGDAIVQEVVLELDRHSNGFLPREETRRLICAQDRVLDAAERLTVRLAAYRPEQHPASTAALLTLASSAVGVLEAALQEFGESRHFAQQMSAMMDIQNQADELCFASFRDAVKQGATDPILLLACNDVCGTFEKIADRFVDCIQTLEDVAIKTLDA
jgi:uncharacterized protein Yka (UPF0111/DUF47 family)